MWAPLPLFKNTQDRYIETKPGFRSWLTVSGDGWLPTRIAGAVLGIRPESGHEILAFVTL